MIEMLAFTPGSALTLALVAMVTGLLGYWLTNRMKYNYPPTPGLAIPLIGHTYKISMSNFCKQCLEWTQTYGPVLTLHLGPMKLVVVNKIDIALEVLVKKSTDFANRMVTPTVRVFTEGGKDIAFSNYTPTWKLHRKMSSKALRQLMQGPALEQRIHNAMVTVFAEMDKIVGKPFEPAEYINFAIGNILMGLCFGGSFDFEDKEINFILKAEDELLENISNVPEDIYPPLQYLIKSKAFKRVEDATQTVLAYIKKRYSAELATYKPDAQRHLADHLILARQEAKEEEDPEVLASLTETHITQTLADIFFAGIDTSRLTLRFAVLHMIANPKIQQKVQQEIDRVVGPNRLPCLSDRPDLAYTEAVLHESMRLSTVAPTGVFHKTLSDTSIGEYMLPKGTPVAINHWALHHDPEAWGDVDAFIPERFLDEDGKLGPKPKSWLPFSAGKRVCLGEFVAKPELHLLFACLMQRYTWGMEEGKIPDLAPIASIFVMYPKEQDVVIKRRF
ncbi:steroid 17-alpha-hydroxylase/17,20 lyase-like isoform X2 [Dreissena polymorpha]|uniref:Cytochrome P450 n=2 Tax=Dreissena polymorpha TaxID=45954 RepID=A0A9D4BHN3_DREPO|nr:steroid 17-alpha-hydroxylase/17,20 lyase-like isoform X2 [Dreissena polymorpha]XP_052257778.1 steroid 17-alpha-hydroxylase/17,20 lyase-like isoform X2 [Dreissena polymorpha]KAH3693893.1 hypothetical protein DPMN_081332 [Dreissena polymorpha]